MAGVIRAAGRGAAIATGARPPMSSFALPDLEAERAEILRRAHQEAAEIAARAREEAKTLARQAREAAYTEGFEQGRRDGHEQARREASEAALREARGELDRLRNALAAALREYERGRRDLLAAAETGLVRLALEIAERVCKLRVQSDPAVAAANVRSLLDLVGGEHDITLHVHPCELEAIDRVVTELSGELNALQHVKLVADQQLERGDCRLSTRHGTIDARLATQLDRIAAVLCGSPNDE